MKAFKSLPSWQVTSIYRVCMSMRVNATLEHCESVGFIMQFNWPLFPAPPALQVSSPLTSGHVKCNYNFLSWVTLFSTLIALINLMYLVADSDWGSLLGVLFLRLAMTEYALGRAAAMTSVSLSLWRHDTSPARRSRPIIKIFLSVYS